MTRVGQLHQEATVKTVFGVDGVAIRPVAILEVGDRETKVRPIPDLTRLALAGRSRLPSARPRCFCRAVVYCVISMPSTTISSVSMATSRPSAFSPDTW